MNVSTSRPDRFMPGERTLGTLSKWGWVPTSRLDTVVKIKISCLCQRSNHKPSFAQPTLCTDYAIPAPKCNGVFLSLLALQPQFGPWPASMKLSVSLRFTRSWTFGRTPWAGDQLVARPLPVHKHRKTHIHTQTRNIHALSGIRTNDPSFRASKDSDALDRSVTVTGKYNGSNNKIIIEYFNE
jgi:hypothetical protein